MAESSAPLGIDLSTTLVGSGLTLIISGTILAYGTRVEAFTNAELHQLIGGVFLGCGLALGLLLAALSVT